MFCGGATIFTTLWAVHISDGVLAPSWLAGGFLLAGLLAWLGCLDYEDAAAALRERRLTRWLFRPRLPDEEIPRVAVLSSAFFVASSIHLRIGPTSVHLLLNGLVGIILGPRAALAIPLGLFLQWMLLGHGGISTLGVNSCVMVLPALAAWLLFRWLQQHPWTRNPASRAALVGFSAFAWSLSLAYSAVLLYANFRNEVGALDYTRANQVALHPLTLLAAGLLGALAGWWERRSRHTPEFALGLLLGELTVLATAVLNCVVLLGSGGRDWSVLALSVLVAHLPLAVLEGLIVGFTLGFLARVKPEMLGMRTPIQKERTREEPVAERQAG